MSECPNRCECGEPRMTMSHENTVATYRCGRGGRFYGDEWRFDNLPICAQRQLAQALEREATEGARAGKAEADKKELRLRMDIRDRGNIAAMEEIARQAEKAEADLKTNAGLLAHQTDLAREAEIGKAKAEERERRLREASLPVAKQLDEPVVGGADGSRCRLVPEGLLRTLREALAAKDVVGAKQPPAGEPAETLLARIDTLKAEVKELRKILSAWVSRCAEEPLPRRRMTVTPEQRQMLIHELREFARAYPEDIFTPFTEEELKRHSVIITRASAAAGRHFAPWFLKAAAALGQIDGEVPAQGEEADDGEAKG